MKRYGFGHRFEHRFGYRSGHRSPSLLPLPPVLLFDFVRPRLQKRLMEHRVVEGQKIGAAIMQLEIELGRRPAFAPARHLCTTPAITFLPLLLTHTPHTRSTISPIAPLFHHSCHHLTYRTTLPPFVPPSHLWHHLRRSSYFAHCTSTTFSAIT